MAFVCNLLIRLRIIDGIYSTLSYSIHELIRARPLAAIVNYKAVSKSITLTGYSKERHSCHGSSLYSRWFLNITKC